MHDIHVTLKIVWVYWEVYWVKKGGKGAYLQHQTCTFPVEDSYQARTVLTEARFDVANMCRPLVRTLTQECPKELGETLVRNGTNIMVYTVWPVIILTDYWKT